MKINILVFGIVTDILGKSSILLDIPSNITIIELKDILLNKYQKLSSIHNFAFAINEEYADDTQIIYENDTIAIIPPVSGG